MKIVVACALAACVLVGAQSAWSRTLDLQRADDVATSAASALGQVERMDCWRTIGAVHTRQRHSAICVAHVRTASGDGCYVFYELGLARKPSRAVRIKRSWEPWCTSAQPSSRSGNRTPQAAALVRAAAGRYGEVERVGCRSARRPDGRALGERILCGAWLASPAEQTCVITYEVRRGKEAIATNVPWCVTFPATAEG